MEYDKQIEIKLDGNKCIIIIPPEQNISSKSLNKILNQNNNSLTNIDDISFSVSITSDENMNSKNNFYNNYGNNIKNLKNNDINNNNKYLYSNEKSKLEITYQSIFYSDLKSETSNLKTPLLLLNCKNNIETQEKKDSVVKKLNFDLSNSNNSKNKSINSNYTNSNISNISNNSNKRIDNIQKEILKNINKINEEIQNINVRKLPLINKNNNNNFVKKISKNLNKEYFIHEKIYASNKNKNDRDNNDKEAKILENIKLNKKVKERNIKIENKNNNEIINKNCINNKNEMPNINNHQKTENCLSKVKSNNNFLLKTKNKNPQEKNKINNHLLLYKCSSKPNISNMKLKLNNLMKLNPKVEKDKENININNNMQNNIDVNNNEIDYIQINKPNNNNILNKKEKEKESKKAYPHLTSANSFNTSTKNINIKSYNSYNQSAKISKLQKNNLNTNNSNLKTPSLINKQIIVCTPKTDSYTCSTSYSAKNNISPRNNKKNFENKSSDLKMENNTFFKNLNKDPILSKVEAHNSLLKNFFLNPNNFKKQEKSDEYLGTNNNNFSNINQNEKAFDKNCLDVSINTNKMSLRKFNTDLKIPLKKNKQLSLLTERNLNNNNNNNNYYNNYGYQGKYNNSNDLQKIIKKKEFDIELWNSIKK